MRTTWKPIFLVMLVTFLFGGVAGFRWLMESERHPENSLKFHAEALSSTDRNKRKNAADEIARLLRSAKVARREFKPEVLQFVAPALLKSLNDPVLSVRKSSAWALEELQPATAEATLPYLTAAGNTDEEIRSVAFRGLARLQRERISFEPYCVRMFMLLELDQDDRHRKLLRSILVESGAVETCIEQLQSGSVSERQQGAEKLSLLGPDGSAATAILLEQLLTEPVSLNESASKALYAIKPSEFESAALLLHAINRHQQYLQRVPTLIRDLELKSPAALEPLAQLLGDLLKMNKPFQVQRDALLVLGYLRDKTKLPLPVTKVLFAYTSDDSAQHALASRLLETSGASALPGLRLGLKSGHPAILTAASQHLKALGSAAREAGPDLLALLQHEDKLLRLNIEQALCACASGDPEILKALGQLLGHERPYVREAAAYTLGSMGPAARGAIPDLTLALQHNSPVFRRVVIHNLVAIGKEDRTVAAALSGALRDHDSNVRIDAAKALQTMGETARICAAELTFARIAESSALRLAARDALKLADPEGGIALPILTAVLEQGSSRQSVEAAEALADYPGKAAQFIAVLHRAALSGDPDLRCQALESLYRLGKYGIDLSFLYSDLEKLLATEPPAEIREVVERLLALRSP